MKSLAAVALALVVTAPPDLGVKRIDVSGEDQRYRFAVTLLTADRGCEHYADWWEVLDDKGRLLYRRILAHSHVDEQPFTRGGGPVPIAAAQKVIVRYHMNDTGYSTRAMVGSATDGFKPLTLPENFAPHLEKKPPQPDGCAY